ncbi:hypothetical protein [Bradyrhizobium sp. NBAIM08]|uniref:hypothetical protein n=1 Tax=Bradyrhizobium sp. NBAIM08 TaxID=2793815 RepID=UPI001CD44251|nr:hypothetical protein [Bradyrhizobium sp. NBAIM08]MCA1474231.1 hypothetical protein [Bradyrhizobium sp. NBAIM08]
MAAEVSRFTTHAVLRVLASVSDGYSADAKARGPLAPFYDGAMNHHKAGLRTASRLKLHENAEGNVDGERFEGEPPPWQGA